MKNLVFERIVNYLCLQIEEIYKMSESGIK